MRTPSNLHVSAGAVKNGDADVCFSILKVVPLKEMSGMGGEKKKNCAGTEQ